MKKFSIAIVSIALAFAMSYNMLAAPKDATTNTDGKETAKYVALSKYIVDPQGLTVEEMMKKIITKKLDAAETSEAKVNTVSELVSMTIAVVVDWSRMEMVDGIKVRTETIMGSTV